MRDASNLPDGNPNGHAEAATQNTTGALHATRSALAGELRHLITDVEDLAKRATSLSGAELESIRAGLATRIAATREAMNRLGSSVSDGARSTAHATDDYVHAQPWRAVGISAAVGLLVGFALARR
jgi:ElaB/YqjD/DUF883 family membrane-anchored ribosome-binding protein